MSIKVLRKQITDVAIDDKTSNLIYENDDEIYRQEYTVTLLCANNYFDKVRYLIEGGGWVTVENSTSVQFKCPYGKRVYYYGIHTGINLLPVTQVSNPITQNTTLTYALYGNLYINLEGNLKYTKTDDSEACFNYDSANKILTSKGKFLIGAACVIDKKKVTFQQIKMEDGTVKNNVEFNINSSDTAPYYGAKIPVNKNGIEIPISKVLNGTEVHITINEKQYTS